MQKSITSLENPIIKLIKDLKEKKGRETHKLILLEGHKIIEEAVSSDQIFSYLLVQEDKLQAYATLLQQVSCEVIITTESIIQKCSTTKNAQGILGVIQIQNQEETKVDSHFLVLDTIQDPGNLGAIIRSAAASGFTHIFCINCVDCYNEKVIRASMGNLFKVHFHFVTIEGLRKTLQTIGAYELYLADMHGENLFQLKVPPDKFIGILIGNEGSGVQEALKPLATKTISIPMQNQVESLNAAVSASIMMYQMNK